MKNNAQSLIEYVIMFSLIVAALFAMQVYLKRGMSGRIKGSADEIGGGFFYSPGATQSTITVDTTVGTKSSSKVSDLDGSTDYKVSVLDTKLESSRTTNRVEEVLPFSAEPARR